MSLEVFMKKSIGLLVLLLLITTGCGTAAIDNSAKNEDAKQNEVSGKVDKKEAEEKIDLTSYKPKTGVKKTFTSQDKLMFTEYIVDQNDKYIQRIITLGNMETNQVVKWTADQATIVYEESNSGEKESMLDDFEAVEEVDTILAQPQKEAELEITKVDGIEVPFGTFNDVIKVSKNQSKEEMRITTFYAPEVGLIKQVFELTGDHPDQEIAVLNSIE